MRTKIYSLFALVVFALVIFVTIRKPKHITEERKQEVIKTLIEVREEVRKTIKQRENLTNPQQG